MSGMLERIDGWKKNCILETFTIKNFSLLLSEIRDKLEVGQDSASLIDISGKRKDRWTSKLMEL